MKRWCRDRAADTNARATWSAKSASAAVQRIIDHRDHLICGQGTVLAGAAFRQGFLDQWDQGIEARLDLGFRHLTVAIAVAKAKALLGTPLEGVENCAGDAVDTDHIEKIGLARPRVGDRTNRAATQRDIRKPQNFVNGDLSVNVAVAVTRLCERNGGRQQNTGK
jgi:hypothetical protein